MWLTFGIIFVAIILYATEKLPLEVTSLGVITGLLLLFHFMPYTTLVDIPHGGEGGLSIRSLLDGFSDPALITILALLVVGQGLVQTGALDELARLMVRAGVKSPKTVTIFVLAFVLVVSAIMNNTPVVVIFIPILSAMAARQKQSASLLMIPLSFAAILGGNLTLIGSSTNLLVSGTLETITGDGLDFFAFTVPGLVLAGVGFIYVALIAPKILKDHTTKDDNSGYITGKQFIVEFYVTEGSGLEGQHSVAGMFPDIRQLTIRMIQRGPEQFLPPFDDMTLEANDRLVVASTRQELTQLLKKSPDMLTGTVALNLDCDHATANTFLTKDMMLAEAVIAPASRMEGRNLAQIGFYQQNDCVILGVQRRSRMIRQSLEKIRLEAGDVLLVMGTRVDMMNLRTNTDIVLMTWSMTDMHLTDKSQIALGIFGLVVASAATGLLPIVIAATTGAALMIVGNCLNIHQAARSVDRRIILIVASALAMGTALNATGGAEFLAINLLDALEGFSPAIILSAFFLLIAILTNILSNNATAVLFTPIAVSIAEGLNIDPMPFVVAVIFAANCSFATPMGYQTNLLVMGPGHYRFSDFMRVGIPLIFILWITFSLFAPWYYKLI
jgi:di/tricarboxylate transporter